MKNTPHRRFLKIFNCHINIQYKISHFTKQFDGRGLSVGGGGFYTLTQRHGSTPHGHQHRLPGSRGGNTEHSEDAAGGGVGGGGGRGGGEEEEGEMAAQSSSSLGGPEEEEEEEVVPVSSNSLKLSHQQTLLLPIFKIKVKVSF